MKKETQLLSMATFFFSLTRSWNEYESSLQAKEDLVKSENSQIFHSRGKKKKLNNPDAL